MSFDQPVYSFSYSGGEPPTPTRTPTSPSFFLNSFETPRQDSKFPDVRSPWGNAFANALSPSFKTPTFASFSPTTPTDHGGVAGKDIAAEIESHEQASKSSNSAAPVEGSNHHTTFSPLDFSSYVVEDGKTQDGLKTSIETSVSSAGSMQTPPPTSTSVSRRKAQKAQTARLVKDSASKNARRLSLPGVGDQDHQQAHNTLAQESPSQFPNLQFSPDGFSFPVCGPATAPVYPQQKLFWDPEQNANGINIDMSLDDTFTAFPAGTNKNMDPFSSDNEHGSLVPFSTSPAFNTVETGAGVPSSSHAPALNQMNISSSTAIMTQGSFGAKQRGTLVNPSLLFSSPSRAQQSRKFVPPDHATQDDILQPYAQQIRDAQFEKEAKSRKQKRKRPPEYGDSPAVKAAIEALREDNLDSTKSSPVLADSFFGALPNGPPKCIQGVPPRKRLTPESHYDRRGSQSSLHRRKSDKIASKRTSVTLKIDASGRAATETSVIRESDGIAMDVDDQSDSSDGTSSASDAQVAVSRQQSFSRPHSRQERIRKARFADEPFTHSQKSSDTSTLVSAGSGDKVAMPRDGFRMKTAGYPPFQAPSSHSYIRYDHNVDEGDTEPDSEEDAGDAQSELKKVVQKRALRVSGSKATWPTSRRNFTDGCQSYASEASRSRPSHQSYGLKPGQTYQATYDNISPTTITDPDLTTPNSGREGNVSGDSTRCICNRADDNGQLMIQCESCRKWLHTGCVGLKQNNLPTVYLCAFCTVTPRAVRGGRQPREPAKGAFQPPGSPLAHKSRHYR